MTLKEFTQAINDHPSVALVRRERPYKLPKGYIRWETLSAIVGASVAALSDRYATIQLSQDQASLLNAYRTTLWFVQDAPLYCISTELLREFQETDILDQNHLLADLEIVVPTFLLVLPENAIRTPEGANLPYCLVHVSDRNHPEWSRGSAYGISLPALKHEHAINLHWSSVDIHENVWFSGMGIDGGSCFWNEKQLGTERISDAEQGFLRQMRSIVSQCLLTLAYMPELIESPIDIPPTHHRSPVKYRTPLPNLRQPRWIGRTYQRPSKSMSLGGTHASPRGHWRRSHWRRVAVGMGRTARRWHKFPCTFVQPTDT